MSLEIDGKPTGVKYIVCQLEKGEHEHVQGYIQLVGTKSLSWLKHNISATAHWTKARGTAEQNKVYCTKEATRVAPPLEYGTFPQQGQRTDLEEIAEQVKKGVPMKQIADDYPSNYIRYHRGIKAYQELQEPARDGNTPVIVEVHYGVPRAGKSTACNVPGAYRKPPGNKWWDGYAGEKTVILNDFNGGWFPYGVLMNVLDPFECRVEQKGGMVQLAATRFLISSNEDPKDWYKNEQYAALEGRITSILYYPSPYPYTIPPYKIK